MTVYEQIKRALQDVVAPELRAIKGEIKRLDGRIEAIDVKIDSVRNELLAKIEGFQREVRISLEIRERLAALEAKVGIARQ